MTHDFQKKQVADLFAQFNPQPAPVAEIPQKDTQPEDKYAGVYPYTIPQLKLTEAVSEPDKVSLVLLYGMNPHLCEIRFTESMTERTMLWVMRRDADKILEDGNYFFHSWYIKGDTKLGKIYMKG